MKVLCTADWHIGNLAHGRVDSDGRNSRYLEARYLLKQIVDIAEQEEVDLLLMAGDIFHSNRPTTDEQLIFLDFLYALEEKHIPSRFIIGNHDYNSQLGKSDSLAIFRKIKNLKFTKIYKDPDNEVFGQVCFIYLPYGSSYVVSDLPDHSKAVLVIHDHFQGAKLGSELFELKKPGQELLPKQFPVDFIVAGHFHRHQIISNDPLCFYTGSIHKVDFNERDDDKVVVILDTETGNIKPVSLDCLELVQVDLVYPKISFDDDELELLKDKIVKVRVFVSEKDAHNYDENLIKKQLKEAGVHKIAQIQFDIDRKISRRNEEITFDIDLLTNFKRFMASKDYGSIHSRVMVEGERIIDQVKKGIA